MHMKCDYRKFVICMLNMKCCLKYQLYDPFLKKKEYDEKYTIILQHRGMDRCWEL